MNEPLRITEPWYVAATASRTDDRTRVLKNGRSFAVFDRFGDIHHIGSGEQGLYHNGTRFLSRLELRVNNRRPLLLNSNVKEDNSLLTIDLTTPDLAVGERIVVKKGTVHLFRGKLLWNDLYREHLRIVNYDAEAVELRLCIEFAADFADIFEVRGIQRSQRGRDAPPELAADRVVLGYRGRDGVARRTVISGHPRPDRLTADRIEYDIRLEPAQQADIHLSIDCESGEAAATPAIDYVTALHKVSDSLQSCRRRSCLVHTSNEQFNQWLSRSAADLAMLTNDNPEGAYPYAGVPWYSTPFGRDGILTALFYLWADPAMARSVLTYLARWQATADDPDRDAEPGKILHETREGELAATGEIPFGHYYGSIDSTPLFIVLAGAYYRRTGDRRFVQRLWPSIELALTWIDRYGDRDGDGFVEYLAQSERGLVNQGWKGSHDAIFHADGRLAQGSVALAEVQGYVYMARLDAAELALALGDTGRATLLKRAAAELRERFEQSFWSERLGTYALALDGDKLPCEVLSSNAGQVLWSGIASPERARRTAELLLSPAAFSGWGIRTVAEGEARHNPMSYHNGSVWPHDNAMAAMGFASYGMDRMAQQVLEALFQASLFMDQHRLPELYCGFVRRPGEGPTLYPVACAPQAWASASPFYLLQACLGLSFHVDEPRLLLDHPSLPACLERVHIANLQLGDAAIDIQIERHGSEVAINVQKTRGSVDVSVAL